MADVNSIRSAAGSRVSAIDEGLRAHMNKVYGTMSIGMLITFAAAWAISGLSVTADPSAAVAQLSQDKYLTQLGYALYASPLKWVVMFAPLAFVFGFGAMINRMSAATAQVVFYAFAAVMGISISSIFLVFTGYSIAQVFLITSIAFAGLSLWGYTTKKDISGWGSFLIMGVIGLVVASIVNIFLASSALMFAISAIGVLIFAGLTAYDTQKIKTEYLAHAHHGDTEWLGKAAIMGALSLYLDFINMFMMLLSLFGNRE
ncbi:MULTISPECIES: Bax inhibitor-1/YccA family protein [Sulfitobacter]|uniref:Bax inhibitor-1/YccA family protein n=1 Tax=Sulfitobacter TaxID=60136 RepID=UPI002307993D|nr:MULTISPECIES: Bax inhibitor-1/YccA family protein [Sulfitobacter]MDF3382494.1 Bax inhibitor-1/YccA family protein [Sulfitobacter sp. Ks11]MDF3385913.1 Bax inhibitor-1/YccA family protein [Sulfitobacter sp. M85]MDF3389332.1 Bax inhibitor-1/YccA family protein [Sulfitobacter sp. Ks16]MDF3399969.1 Bax inhibitor-1/YccA family protein [Sulfitobacter sp. KE39]MDF3403390.1 Bax inhibitor-1/YccA family protein [Sulfitobacter sp. Ks35]